MKPVELKELVSSYSLSKLPAHFELVSTCCLISAFYVSEPSRCICEGPAALKWLLVPVVFPSRPRE